MKLNKSEYCPIHRSRACCGRTVRRLPSGFESGIRRVMDKSNSRGYRELRSPSEMKRLLARKVVEQDGRCGICGRRFKDFRDIVPDHVQPKGMGGARRDDHPDNVQAAHRLCNLNKGSKRL